MKYFLRNRLKNTQHPMFEKSDPLEIKYRNLSGKAYQQGWRSRCRWQTAPDRWDRHTSYQRQRQQPAG